METGLEWSSLTWGSSSYVNSQRRRIHRPLSQPWLNLLPKASMMELICASTTNDKFLGLLLPHLTCGCTRSSTKKMRIWKKFISVFNKGHLSRWTLCLLRRNHYSSNSWLGLFFFLPLAQTVAVKTGPEMDFGKMGSSFTSSTLIPILLPFRLFCIIQLHIGLEFFCEDPRNRLLRWLQRQPSKLIP